jgi:hypothetical protein
MKRAVIQGAAFIAMVMKSIMVGFSCFLLTGCASGPVENKPRIQIRGMQIENQTQMWVSAVRLLVPVNGNFVSCGNIVPGTSCSTTFPETEYTGNPVEITWSQGGQIYSTGEFAIQLPADLDEDKPVMVSIVISAPGSAGAVFLQ